MNKFTFGRQVKETLSSQSYAYFSTTLSDYKKTEDFLKMVSCLAEIFTSNAQSHHLFRRKPIQCFSLYRYSRPSLLQIWLVAQNVLKY